MEVKLVVVGGATAQASEFSIQPPMVIGRSRTADLPLANPLVSRRHCEVFEAGGQLMVRDLGSLNGTFVGKTRVADEAAVPPGSMLTVGAITFRADYVGANGAAAPAPPAPAAAASPAPGTSDSDSTVEVSEMETLEPIGESAGDAEFDLNWLDESTGESGDSNGAPAGAKETVPVKQPAKGAKGKAAADKTKKSDESDNLDDLL